MSRPPQTSGVDFQLTAFGAILHFRKIPGDFVEKCLLPGWKLSRPDRDPNLILEWDAQVDGMGFLRLLADGQRVAETRIAGEGLPGALDQSLHLAVAEFSPEAVFLHAGVAVWNGAAVLIPGRSHAGKSTLTKSLIDAGASYYSDEFAPVLPNGLVIPYPKPLSLRSPDRRARGTGPGEPPARIHPARLGWRLGLPPVPVGIIAAVVYDPENPDARPKPISKAEATTLLLRNTVPMLKAPSRSLTAASQVARNALCFGGARPEASGYARRLLRCLSLEHA